MWAIAAAVSLAMAIQASAEWIQSLDEALYSFVVDHETELLVSLGGFLGVVGSVMVMAPLALSVAVILGFRGRFGALSVWVGAIALSQLVAIILKNLYGRPRPLLPLVETTRFSFPSGHALTGAVVAIGLLIVLVAPEARRRWYLAMAVVYIAAMAWSRVYVRAHWLSDVTTGVAIGGAIVLSAALMVTHLGAWSEPGAGVDGQQS